MVQNAQMLQYDQMHVALQTARNQASLETPLQAEELMTAHFNLGVLLNETKTNETVDAQKPEATTLDAEPSTSTADEEITLRYPVGITLQITIQRRHTLLELSSQPVEETTDLLTEYQQVTRLMILGITILLLMSRNTPIHTHIT